MVCGRAHQQRFVGPQKPLRHWWLLQVLGPTWFCPLIHHRSRQCVVAFPLWESSAHVALGLCRRSGLHCVGQWLVGILSTHTCTAAWLAIPVVHHSGSVDHLLGWQVIAGVPIDEVLFFVVVPLASVLTLEAVRSVRGWSVGDEGDS